MSSRSVVQVQSESGAVSRRCRCVEWSARSGWWPLAVVAAGLLAAALSCVMGVDQSTWFDENYSILICSQSWRRMIELTAVDVHPPLYYVLLKAWASVFGWGAVSLRLLSAVFLGCTVMVAGALLRHLFGVRNALYCLPFLVIAPCALRYGYEIRMYALTMLLGVLGTYVLIRAVGVGRAADADGGDGTRHRDMADVTGARNRNASTPALARVVAWICRNRWWIAYTVVIACGMYTQYLMALVWISHAVWLALRSWLRRGEGVRAWSWLLADVAGAVLYLPWIPALLGQMMHPSLPVITTTMGPGEMTTLLTVLFTGLPGGKVSSLLGLLMLAVAVLFVRMLLRSHDRGLLARYGLGAGHLRGAERGNVRDADPGMERGAGRSRPEPRIRALAELRTESSRIVWLACLFAFPLLLMTCYSAVQERISGYGFFMIRYVCPFLMFFYMALGMVCVRGLREDGDMPVEEDSSARRRSGAVHGRIGAAVCALMAVLLLIGTGLTAWQGNYSYERASLPAAKTIAAKTPCSAQHPVVADGEYAYIDAWYYYRECPAYRFLQSDDVSTRGGYAPLHDSPVQLRHLDDLDVDGFSLVITASAVKSKTLPQAKDYTVVGSRSYGLFAVVEYDRLAD